MTPFQCYLSEELLGYTRGQQFGKRLVKGFSVHALHAQQVDVYRNTAEITDDNGLYRFIFDVF